LPMYVYNNTLPPGSRKLMVACLVAGAIAAAGCGLGWSIIFGGTLRGSHTPREGLARGNPALPPADRPHAGLNAIERVSRRLAPLCLAAFVPLLFHWQLWTGAREISFAALASMFGLSLQALLRVALSAPPVLPAHLRARLGALRDDIASQL